MQTILLLYVHWVGSHSKQKRKKAKAKMLNRVLNKWVPNYSLIFSYKSEKTNYNLQDISSGLSLPKPHTNNMKNSFMYDGAQLWNSIPKEIRRAKLFLPFKIKSLLTLMGNKCTLIHL